MANRPLRGKNGQWFSEGRAWAVGIIFAAGMTYMKLLAIETAVTETRKDFVDYQKSESTAIEELQISEKLLEQRISAIERKQETKSK